MDGPRNVFVSLFNHLTRLVAQEYFIIQCRRESYKSYNMIALWDTALCSFLTT
jgi:hypothetical protein